MRCLKKIRLMGISIPELIERKAFCKKAFSTQFSKEFIFAAKQNRLEEMQSFLITHPYLVFAYDYYNMTALHYACKLGFVSMVRMLLHYHADFDAIDLMNRTPLSIAISEN
jgi:ankyrin repeat protein